MKYLYQQLLAFWGVIILIILIVGTSFTQLTKKTLQDNNYEQLRGYAISAWKAKDSINRLPGMTDQDIWNTSFSLFEGFLSNQDVQFVFYDRDMKVQYPLNTEKKIDDSVIKENWAALMEGQQEYATINKDIYGNNHISSYVMMPVSQTNVQSNENVIIGALVITQPAKNVSDSMDAITANLFKGFIISSIVGLILSYFFASFQVKRINRMRKATKEITSGNFDVKLVTHDKDEFDDLAEDFNKMAESLKESREEIDRQEDRRRQFMADASHEMRTPLTTINGLLEGLQYNAIPEGQREKAIKLMQNETSRLIRLVNENLDYEKIRTNQISIVVKKFNATETLKDILTQLEGKAETANDKLILEADDAIDVYADYDRFVQIMVNIIQNAIQFTQDGEIRVHLQKGYLETIITISDTGIGMTEEQVQNIWDRYYKVDPSRKNTKYGESGLGLSIVEQLVRLHKGKIHVESQEGKGTSFTISFPDVEIEDVT
ncbi:two-component sensor histidine kinase [Enterococcus plantarum]|uniref:histidine kinase n=1 Tax=Enterococcus plantarum TaxID=1077675 RepID=A0A2W4A6H7_9ENTE|nr:HAMP domain-containing sensor histidine kinase [Enterococcus plantarum]MBO0422970.1 HAMP domain-containing histidine kinase [Enterococcus plantarum]MBO0468288.1 HAMP domain-containing histidine kinase [Enterococcus plantarum]OEG12640.1 two-component sensor histidine kinase [Enterococcus plantarum]PZL76623.1 sensor histidine kinase [Enterococcus plantarum]